MTETESKWTGEVEEILEKYTDIPEQFIDLSPKSSDGGEETPILEPI